MKTLVAIELKEEMKKKIKEFMRDAAEVFFLDEEYPDEIDVLVVFRWRGVADRIVEKLKSLKFIQCLTQGVDHIDFNKIGKNVKVARGIGENAPYIAEHVFALLLASAKRIIFYDSLMKRREFRQDIYVKPLKGKTMSILGLGPIGIEVAKRAKAFGMKVIGITRTGKTNIKLDFIGTLDSLEKVLSCGDYIVIALPLTKRTRGLIGRKELKMMKKDAILINVARGKIIDEEALYHHLKENPDFTACLDALWRYPKNSEYNGQNFPFEELPNVIMTPHISTLVPDYFENMLWPALENVKRYMKTGKADRLVNRDDYI